MGAAHVGKSAPPLLIIHGDKDGTVGLVQSQRMVDKYRKHKRDVTLKVVQGTGHGGKLFFEGPRRKLVVEFLRKHLRPAKAD